MALLGEFTVVDLDDDNRIAPEQEFIDRRCVNERGDFRVELPDGRVGDLQVLLGKTSSNAADESQLVERSGHPVTVVPGSPINLKITSKEDLRLASQMLKALPKPKNILGSHPFADDDMWR